MKKIAEVEIKTRLGKREGQYDNRVKIAAVNFSSKWGDKKENLKKICEYIDQASAKGCGIIAFPEMSLVGYDNIPGENFKDKMQVKEAETVPGKTTTILTQKAKEKKIYILVGLSECDEKHPLTIYNTVAVIGPEGLIAKYRKNHIPFDERDWSTPGDEITVFNTPWGPMGVAICYDVYAFPEIARICAAYGARVFFNITAHTVGANVPNCETEIEDTSITNGMYVVTASMSGKSLSGQTYSGGSSVVGLGDDQVHVKYFAGHPFYSELGRSEGMVVAELDLSRVDKVNCLPIYSTNPYTGKPDFTPERYARWYQKLSESPIWRERL